MKHTSSSSLKKTAFSILVAALLFSTALSVGASASSMSYASNPTIPGGVNDHRVPSSKPTLPPTGPLLTERHPYPKDQHPTRQRPIRPAPKQLTREQKLAAGLIIAGAGATASVSTYMYWGGGISGSFR